MTPRYTRQRDQFRCGPVAIMNALKWAGKKCSYDELRDPLTRSCKCKSPHGTKHRNFDAVLREAGKKLYSVRRVYHPTLAEIESHLRGGGAIVLNYKWGKNKYDRHFHLLTGVSPSGDFFYTVNNFPLVPVLYRLDRKMFKKHNLRFQRTDSMYKGWFLEKV
jgi:hypothetical protein